MHRSTLSSTFSKPAPASSRSFPLAALRSSSSSSAAAAVASASSFLLFPSPLRRRSRRPPPATAGAVAAAAAARAPSRAEQAQPFQRRPRAAGPSSGTRLRGPSFLPESSGSRRARILTLLQSSSDPENREMVEQLETTTTMTTTTTTTTALPAPPPPPAPSSPAPLPPRQSSGVPVYVMLPLDTVDGEGRFRYGTTSTSSSSPSSSSGGSGSGNGNGENGNGNGNTNTTTTTTITPWFSRALREIAAAGAHGVAVDVWWGAVERSPRHYDFRGYRALAAAVRDAGLRLQVVLSFHACGGNVGDDAAIPLPAWVEEAAVGDADLFYADAPRGGAVGRRNPECVSLFADGDDGALGGGRSPMQCYREFMQAFRAEFEQELGCGKRKKKRRQKRSKAAGAANGEANGGGGEEFDDGGDDDEDEEISSLAVIDEVVVGAGPCGELRYPSYFEPHGWRFPGVGEFQCHDRRARASLAEAARKVGRPEWGYAGPHDAGSYNDAPDATGFFAGWGGAWDSEYGKFFINWYAGELLAHGERLADAAVSVFGLAEEDEEDDDDEEEEAPAPAATAAAAKAAAAAVSLPSPTTTTTTTTVPLPPPLRREARSTSLASMDSDVGGASIPASASVAALALAASAAANGGGSGGGGGLLGRGPPPAWDRASLPARPRGLSVALKVAGVHWWYRHPSHAAELTAGYSNARASGESYDAIVALCAAANLGLTLTCVEMCDGQHPPEALCGPEGLLRQVREAAAARGVALGGENALPVFGPGHADGRALARVAYNTDAWAPPLQEAARARDELYGSLTQGNDGMMNSVGEAGDGEEGGGAGRRGSGSSGSPSSSTPRSPSSSSAATAQQQQQPPPPSSAAGTPPTTPPSPSTLPPMRSFTFLRLTPSMLEPPISDEWRAFVRRMRGGGNNGGGGNANVSSDGGNANANASAAAALADVGGDAMVS